VTADNALEPVIVEGTAELVTDRSDVVAFTEVVRTKYTAEWIEDVYTVDFFDANLGGGGTYRVTPASVFALRETEFSTSPTLWTF
jgi:hypothetical protein